MKKETDKKLKECQKLKEEYLAGWKRTQADFLNYKKEEGERINARLGYLKEEWLLKMILILDNIDIAESNMPDDLGDNHWVKGLLQIKKQILDFLKTEEVKEIKAIGEKFDPNFHEVIMEAESKGKEPGIIIEEFKKGYVLNNKVIRPSRVKISK